MIREKTIADELEFLERLGTLAETYKIITASEVRTIRQSVLNNRTFHKGLSRIFQEVKRAYRKETERLFKERKILQERPVSLIQPYRKTVFVLLSSNTGLYGEIVSKTFSFFLSSFQKEEPKPDVVIIGRVGKVLFEKSAPLFPHVYFEVADSPPDPSSVRRLSEYLKQYEEVVVFHGIFKNLLSQIAISVNVSGSEPTQAEAADIHEKVFYLFEPTLETIVIFFENELFASLVGQAFHEWRLAKVSNRLVLMDRASQNIERSYQESLLKLDKIHHRLSNKRLLNSLSGISLWGVQLERAQLLKT